MAAWSAIRHGQGPEWPDQSSGTTGIDDCLVFKDEIVDPVEPYSDIDKALRSNAGNPLPPGFMVRPFFRLINKKMWKKGGIAKL
jgi:hypothetical protein